MLGKRLVSNYNGIKAVNNNGATLGLAVFYLIVWKVYSEENLNFVVLFFGDFIAPQI